MLDYNFIIQINFNKQNHQVNYYYVLMYVGYYSLSYSLYCSYNKEIIILVDLEILIHKLFKLQII